MINAKNLNMPFNGITVEPMVDFSKIGSTVRVGRMKLGLTQAQLAELAHVGKGRIEAIENGRSKNIGFGTVIEVLDALGYALVVQLKAQGAAGGNQPEK